MSNSNYSIGGIGTVPEASPMVNPVAGTKLLMKRSDTQGKKPAAGDAEYGELFINYHSNTPMLCFKDNADTIVEIRPLTEVELALGELTDVDTTGQTTGMVLSYDGSIWKPVSAASIAIDVDLGYTAAPDKGTVTNTAGDDAELPLATDALAGLMAPGDKDKLDKYPADPTTNLVDLGYTAAADGGTVTNTGGTDASLPLANGTNAGLSLNNYTTAEKDKLAGVEDGAEANVKPDWDATPGDDDEILNKPDLFSGDYDDLDNKPDLSVYLTDAPTDGEQYARKDGAWDVVEAGGASVSVGENPPADPAEGDLWWDSSDDSGRLYVWYEDGNTNQWVETSPSAGTPDIPDTYWDKTGNVVSPKLATDNVEIGGGDIALNADGSAAFADTVRSPSFFGDATGTAQIWFGGAAGTSSISADGSASFAAGVTSNTWLRSNPNPGSGNYAEFNYDGIRHVTGNSSKVLITNDGNAKFAGTVEQNATIGRSVLIQTEPDNDANYTVTTEVDEEGNEIENRVYNGPTLDVKEVLLDLQQRVSDRDAVIADLTTRIAALEGGTY